MEALYGPEWIRLLSKDPVPSKEHLIFQTRFRKALRIRKHEWNLHFSGWCGLGLRPGDEIELVAQEDAGPQVTIPEWAIQQLQLAKREPGLTDYETARIQSRLDELKELLADEEKQK